MNKLMFVFLVACVSDSYQQEDAIFAYEDIHTEEVEDSTFAQDESTVEEDWEEAIFDPIVRAGLPEVLASGFWFAEGPVWRENGTLLLSDIPANVMYRYVDGTLDIFQHDSGESNGLFAHPDGGVLVAQHRERRIALLEQGEEAYGR